MLPHTLFVINCSVLKDTVNCRGMVITSKVLIPCNAKKVKYPFKEYGDILILHVKRVNESISRASNF